MAVSKRGLWVCLHRESCSAEIRVESLEVWRRIYRANKGNLLRGECMFVDIWWLTWVQWRLTCVTQFFWHHIRLKYGRRINTTATYMDNKYLLYLGLDILEPLRVQNIERQSREVRMGQSGLQNFASQWILTNCGSKVSRINGLHNLGDKWCTVYVYSFAELQTVTKSRGIIDQKYISNWVIFY